MGHINGYASFFSIGTLQQVWIIFKVTYHVSIVWELPEEEYLIACDENWLLETAVGILEIGSLSGRYPDERSGGQKQRAAIGRAVINRPDYIFADEPTGNLDKATEEMTIRLLCDSVRKYGQTLILVTHNPEIAERMQERIVMDEGKLL